MWGDFFMVQNNIKERARQREENRMQAKKPDTKHQMKGVLCGCVVASAFGVFLLCLLSFIMSTGRIPIWSVKAIGIIVGCIMASVAAFFCARYSKKNGFFLGMLCAAIIFLIAFLSSLAVGEFPGFWAAIKLFSMLICGCVFGSIGVNVKKSAK